MLKIIFILLGTISLTLGIIGLFIPGLPTTPFILLTAGLYIRSSDKLYSRLVTSPLIGQYINRYQKNKGMTKKQKIYSISLMWIMIFNSVIFLIQSAVTRIIVIIVGLTGTYVMGFIVKTIQNNNK
ncbi:MAG: YbaN family protein [Bacteroidales bacterium]|nr:YbaN family protein [Bacteroidales bacterium]